MPSSPRRISMDFPVKQRADVGIGLYTPPADRNFVGVGFLPRPSINENICVYRKGGVEPLPYATFVGVSIKNTISGAFL